MKVYKKIRYDNGKRCVYLFGVKIASYTRKTINVWGANKSINYKTYNELVCDIKNETSKIPTDIDLVIGIPRSGMIPAYVVGLMLNKKVCSVQEFINGIFGNKGYIRRVDDQEIKKILVVDDSVNTGASQIETRKLLEPFNDKYEFCFMAVYGANKNAAKNVDVCLKILPQPRIFQWNYMYHKIIENACYDMDGVLCVDPSDEENDDAEKYLNFIKNARPLYIPNSTIGYIVTSRLEKYRFETEEWLRKHGVSYKKLYMLNATAEQRRKLKLHAKFKANIYKKLKDSNFFIESDPVQAKEISELARKKCICCTNDVLYE